MAQEMAATDQLEVSFPRGRLNQTGCYRAQPGGALSVTRVPCFSGEEEEWTDLLWEPARGKKGKNGSFFPRMALSILSALAEPVRLSGPVLAGIGTASNSQPLRNFSCTGCGTIRVHNLLFVPEPVDR